MQHWEQAQDLFELGIGTGEAERQRLLADADPEVAALVRKLWQQPAEARFFLAKPLVKVSPAGVFEKGQRIGGRFRVLQCVGSGGMGEVYKARDELLGRTVAVKAIREDVAGRADFRARLEREARSICGLTHPHICALYDLCWEDDLPFLVMEFLSGPTLAQRIAEGRLPLEEMLRVADAMAGALSFAHGRGIVHRDLKPANVMLTEVGVKLLDFGIAKQVAAIRSSVDSTVTVAQSGTESSSTRQGEVAGSVAYMSPEQAGGKSVDARSDVFSFGAVLYEMATGERAFPGDSTFSTLAAVIGREPRPVRSLAPAAPRSLERIIGKCLAKSPEERYGTASQVRDELRGLGRRPARRGWAVALAAAGLALSAWVRESSISQNSRGVGYRPKSVVVLPFTNLSKDPEMEYVVDGLSESLTNSFSRVPNIRVISRSAALVYKGRSQDPRQIGRELRVDSVVMGRSTFGAGTMRLQTELVDAHSGGQLWGLQYEGTINDALKIQDDIARQVSERLQGRVADNQAGRIGQPTRDPEAFQLYLKAKHALSRYSVADVQRAIGYLDQALERDPNYALAYAALADCYWSLSGSALPPNEAFPKAKAAAKAAAALDSGLAEAHVALGVIHLWYDFSFHEAESELRRAIELNAHDASARLWLGWALVLNARLDEGIAQAKLAHELDPMSPFVETGLGQMYYCAGQPEEAIRHLRNVVAAAPAFYNGHFFLGVAYLHARQYASAIKEFREAERLDATQPFPVGNLAYASAMRGDRSRAEEYLRRLKQLSESRYVPQYLFALVSLGLGDHRSALRSLGRAFKERDDMIAMLKVDHLLDPLRMSPEFKSLLVRAGFDSSGTPAVRPPL